MTDRSGPNQRVDYDVALICENGHVRTEVLNLQPEDREAKFCLECGARNLSACPKCNVPLRGDHVYSSFKFPWYCHSCGSPLPWTKVKLEAAEAIAEEVDELSGEERALLKSSLPDLLADTPKTDVSALRIRRLLKRIGGPAGETLKKIVVDIASEAAKKILTGA